MNEKNYGDFWNRPHLQGALLKRTTGLTLNALYLSSGKCSLLGGPGLSDIKRSEVKMQELPFLLQHNAYPFFPPHKGQAKQVMLMCVEKGLTYPSLIIQFPALQISTFVFYSFFFFLNISLSKFIQPYPTWLGDG